MKYLQHHIRSIALAIAIAALSCASLQSEPIPELTPDSERIMEVILDGNTYVADAMVIFPYRGRWVLPLGQLAESLGLAIQVWPGMKGAEGFVIDEGRPFKLELADCEAKANGSTSEYPCNDAFAFENEIYVTDKLLEQWLPISITVDSYRSEVRLKATELLPEQARKKREQEAQRAKVGHEDYDPGFPRVPTPYSAFRLTSMDQQLIANRNFGTGSDTAYVTSTSQVAGELLHLESNATVTADQRGFQGYRFTLSRNSVDDTLLGPLHARQIRFFDVDLPTIPLVSPGQGVRGFLVSSYPIDSPVNFEETDLQGPLALGWEVVLFRNEVLLDRRLGNSTGIYRFTKVPLQYGQNIFRLSFFGPQGQRRDEFKTFTIDSSQTKAGKRNFRFAVGYLSIDNYAATAQFSEGLGKTLTAVGGAYLQRDDVGRHGYLGVVGVNPLFLYTGRVVGTSLGGLATEVGAQSGIGRATLGAKYAHFFNKYRSRLFNEDPTTIYQNSQLDLNLGYTLPSSPALSLLNEYSRRGFLTAPTESLFRNRLSMMLGMVQLQHELEYAPAATTPLLGRLEGFYMPFALRFRGGLEYTPQKLSAIEAEVQWVKSAEFSVTSGVRVPLDGSPKTFTIQSSRLWPELSLGASLGTSPNGKSLLAGVLLSFSLTRDPRTNTVHMSRALQTQAGSISAKGFLDKNDNGQQDPGEQDIPSISFEANQRQTASANDGVAFLANLRPYIATDVTLHEAELDDPFLRTKHPGFRVHPRPGVVIPLNFPFVKRGQIDGYVLTGATPRRGVPVELWSHGGKKLVTSKSDRNGFYSFDQVDSGKRYLVRVNNEFLLKEKWHAQPAARETKMPAEGAFVSGLDFNVTHN